MVVKTKYDDDRMRLNNDTTTWTYRRLVCIYQFLRFNSLSKTTTIKKLEKQLKWKEMIFH